MVNATDRERLKLLRRQEANRSERARADLKAVLELPEGRRVFLWLLEKLQPAGQNIWNPSAALTGLNAALYDAGNWLRNEIAEMDPDLLVQMTVEARAQEKQEQLERDAQAKAGVSKRRGLPDNENESGDDHGDE